MCQISLTCAWKVEPVASAGHVSRLIYLLCATLATSVVAIGGLGAVQNECSDDSTPADLSVVDGFSVIKCKEIYRYYWFIIALEFVVAGVALVAVSSGKLATYRNTLVGLFSVALLLWIQQSNAFLGVQATDDFNEGIMRDRVRTVIAGSIMTATLNAANILMIGYEADETAPEEKKAPVAVEAKAMEGPSTVTVTNS